MLNFSTYIHLDIHLDLLLDIDLFSDVVKECS